MPSTSRGYPYPAGSDDVDIPGDMAALAAALNTDVGTVVTNAVQHSLADAAGDLAVGSAADTFGRLALGTDNYALTVNTAGSGVAKIGWEDPTANPLTVTAMALKVNTATVGNLLTANQASVETDTTGLGREYQSTVARSTAAARVGSASLAVTCTGGAGAWTAGAATNLVGYQVPVVVGQTYTGVVYTKAAATPRAMNANIRFATGGNIDVSYASGTTATNTTSGWTAYYVTAVAPATAEYAQVYIVSDVTPAANEVHYLDCLGFWEGAGGQWALPGTPITNLGFYTDESVGRRLFQWDANNSRWQMTYGDTGDRQSAITYTNGWANAYGVDMLRRIGNTVYLQVVLDSTSATTDGAFTVPAGFRPSVTAMMAVPVGGSTVVPRTLTMGSAGEATIYQASLAGQAGWFVGLAYQTNDAWPTSLPGTASGSIPA